MKLNGLNVWAIIAAAVAIYAVGAVIYGVLLSEYWLTLTPYSKEEMGGQMWRMALSPAMPILTAIGIALACKWRGVASTQGGVSTALIVFVVLALPVRLYQFVYSAEPLALFEIDFAHLALGHLVGGAILGAWR